MPFFRIPYIRTHFCTDSTPIFVPYNSVYFFHNSVNSVIPYIVAALEIWLLWFFSQKRSRIFRPNGVEIRIFNINSLLRRVKTNFWAKVDIEV